MSRSCCNADIPVGKLGAFPGSVRGWKASQLGRLESRRYELSRRFGVLAGNELPGSSPCPSKDSICVGSQYPKLNLLTSVPSRRCPNNALLALQLLNISTRIARAVRRE